MKEVPMKEKTIYEMAKFTEFNEKAEAQAIYDYTEFIKAVVESSLTDDEKEYIVGVITEIIGDELNHQQKLHELFTTLTEIKTDKD